MRAKDICDHSFERLLVLIDEKRIKPGSPEERSFLKNEIELGVFSMLKTHGIDYFPQVIVEWNPFNPDDLLIRWSDETNTVLFKAGLL